MNKKKKIHGPHRSIKHRPSAIYFGGRKILTSFFIYITTKGIFLS